MSSNFIGLLVIMFAGLVSINLIMAMLNEAKLLAWLNQIFLGIILIAVVSYVIVRTSIRKGGRK